MVYQEDLDFEISFYENLLKKRPNFPEALVALGDAYTKKGRFNEGLKVDKKLVRLKPDDPVVHYNLACDYSLLKKADLSISALKKAIRLGYEDYEFMEKDPDLDFIRKDPRYKELISGYAKKS